MNRAQRRLHAWTWRMLVIVIAGLFLGALVARERTDTRVATLAAGAGPR